MCISGYSADNMLKWITKNKETDVSPVSNNYSDDLKDDIYAASEHNDNDYCSELLCEISGNNSQVPFCGTEHLYTD